MLPKFLASMGFRIAGMAGIVGTIALGAWLLIARVQLADARRTNTELSSQINGYVAQLAQARLNVSTLQVALDGVRHDLEAKAAEDAKILADTQAKLDAANQQRSQAEKQSAAILAGKPQGDTLEAQIRDVDARVMESLK